MGDQRDWVALQERIVRTLQERGVTGQEGPMSEQDAEYLADHLADDVYAMFDLTPRHEGVGSADAQMRRRSWLGLPRKHHQNPR